MKTRKREKTENRERNTVFEENYENIMEGYNIENVFGKR